MLSRPLLLAAAGLGLAAVAASQTGSAAGPLEVGRRALAEGRAAEAAHHLQNALVRAPHSTEILELLLEASAADPDARALWAHAWWAAAADSSGKAKPASALKRLLPPDDPGPERIAAERAAAARELAAFAAARQKRGSRIPEELLVADWARRAALDLAQASPALEAELFAGAAPTLEIPGRLSTQVIASLERVLSSALSNRRTGEAMRAARCLHGLAVQADFKDLKGPTPPELGKLREEAARGLARAREQLADRAGEPWTVEELELLTTEELEALTREHASFASPGVAVSPEGMYRLETDCGFQTLLGAARTVEDHHRRLAGFFGRDPFLERPGTVRLVPEAHGLESEGSPFWWAGGFQSGDLTTLRFSCGTIEGLGRGLTHELTHRFDGAIYPGIPAWLAEGKAVWTGAAYGHSSDLEFIDDHALFGTVEGAMVKGYGGLGNLTKLIEGTVEDYRDNYVAGYALYLYLNTGEEGGRPLFAERLRRYMEGAARGNRDPMAWFLEHFCDGREGRPEDLEGFAERFGTFIGGFYWLDRKPWTERYTRDNQAPGGDPWVYDEPTWVWSRNRAEPWFGQDQARVAGELLLELGRTEEGIRALVWALAVDGRTPAAERLLRGALAEQRDGAPSWSMDHRLAFPHGAPAERAPFLKSLSRTRSLLDGLEEAAEASRAAGHERASSALAADRDRLAAWLGIAPLAAPPLAADEMLHPFDPPPRHAGLDGWVEDELTGYEERRVAGLWYETEDGDLIVGRHRPRTGTGQVDPRAHQRDAFARAGRWNLPGTWRARMRIQFTTSYLSGAVILGYTRRDRNVRFQFHAGDFMYAIGEKEEAAELDSVGWSLHGLRDRDGALPGSTPRGRVEFPRPKTSFELELLVDGPTVHAFVDGERVGAYHTVDGAPIEGYLGFATGFGAVRVRQPTVERLDRSRLAGVPGEVPLGLDLAREGRTPFRELENRPVRGLEPAPNGSLLLWISRPWLEPGEELDRADLLRSARRSVDRAVRLLEREYVTQPLVVALPEVLGQEALTELAAELAVRCESPPRLVTHRHSGRAPEGMEDSPDGNRRWLLFVDSARIARVVMPFIGGGDLLQTRMGHWLTVFRDCGRPERDLPEVKREELLGGEGEG